MPYGPQSPVRSNSLVSPGTGSIILLKKDQIPSSQPAQAPCHLSGAFHRLQVSPRLAPFPLLCPVARVPQPGTFFMSSTQPSREPACNRHPLSQAAPTLRPALVSSGLSPLPAQTAKDSWGVSDAGHSPAPGPKRGSEPLWKETPNVAWGRAAPGGGGEAREALSLWPGRELFSLRHTGSMGLRCKGCAFSWPAQGLGKLVSR